MSQLSTASQWHGTEQVIFNLKSLEQAIPQFLKRGRQPPLGHHYQYILGNKTYTFTDLRFSSNILYLSYHLLLKLHYI